MILKYFLILIVLVTTIDCFNLIGPSAQVVGYLEFQLANTAVSGRLQYSGDPRNLCQDDNHFQDRIHCLIEKIGGYDVYEGDASGVFHIVTIYRHEPVFASITYETQSFKGHYVEINANNLNGVGGVQIYDNTKTKNAFVGVLAPTVHTKLTFQIPSTFSTGEPINSGAYTFILLANEPANIFQDNSEFNLEIKNPIVDRISIANNIETKPTTIVTLHGSDLGIKSKLTINAGSQLCFIHSRTDTQVVCEIFGFYPIKVSFNLQFHTKFPKSISFLLDYHPALEINKVENTHDSRVVVLRMFRDKSVAYNYKFFIVDGMALNEEIPTLIEIKNILGNDYYQFTLTIGLRVPDAAINYAVKMECKGLTAIIDDKEIFPINFDLPEITSINPIMARFTPHHKTATPIQTYVTISGLNFMRSPSIRVEFSSTNPTTHLPIVDTYIPAGGYVASTSNNLIIQVSSLFQVSYQVTVFYESPPGNKITSNQFSSAFEFHGLSCLGRTSPTTPIKNPPVDWWFIYKIRDFAGITKPEIDGYLYHDSKYENEGVNGYQGLSNPILGGNEYSPLAATFKQIQDFGYSYYYYNDQTGRRSATATRLKQALYDSNIHKRTAKTFGHSKGFVIYDAETGEGLHVIHSQPVFPYYTTASTVAAPTIVTDVNDENWVGDRSDSQHFFCYTFGPVDTTNPTTTLNTGINFVTRYVMRNNVMPFKVFDSNPLSKFTTIRNLIDKNHYKPTFETPCNRVTVGAGYAQLLTNCYWVDQFTTKGGVVLDSFSKLPNKYQTGLAEHQTFINYDGDTPKILFDKLKKEPLQQTGFDIYEIMVEYFNEAVRNPNNDLRSYFAQTFQGANIRVAQNIQLNAKLANVEVSTHSIIPITEAYDKIVHSDHIRGSVDHTKLMYNMNPNIDPNDRYGNIFCAGDSNRHNGQLKRGGGSMCLSSPKLVNYFQSRVKLYTNLLKRTKGDSIVYYFSEKPEYGGSQVHLPFMVNTQIYLITYDNKVAKTVLSPGYIFEFTRTYTQDVNAAVVIEEKSNPPTIITTTGSVNEVKYQIYRKETHHSNDWDQAWGYHLKAGNPPIKLYHKYAFESPQFSIYKCFSDHTITKCNRFNADSADSLQVPSTTGVNPFDYGGSTYTKMTLYYKIQAKTSNIVEIKEFIEKLNNYIPFLQGYQISYEFYTQNPPPLQSFVDGNGVIFINREDLDCPDEVRYLLVKKALIHHIKVMNKNLIVNNDILDGLAMAISKYIYNFKNPSSYTAIDNCFKPNFPEFNIEGSQRSLDDDYSFATLFWDWLDFDNDRNYGYNSLSPYHDFNQACVVPVVELFHSVIYSDNIFNMFNSLPIALKTEENENIIYYNTIITKPVLRLARGITPFIPFSNNSVDIDSYFYNLFVSKGYFSWDQITSLSLNDKYKLKDSLNKWFEVSNSNYMVEVLIVESMFYQSQNLILNYISEKYQNHLVEDKVNICNGFMTNYPRICDPLSLVTVTDLIVQMVSNSIPLNVDTSSGIQTFYFKLNPKISNTFNSFNGILFFTLNGKLCGFNLEIDAPENFILYYNQFTITTDNVRSIPLVTNVTIVSGPPQGENEIQIIGFHFINSIFIFIGENECLYSAIIDEFTIICQVPPGRGKQLPIILKHNDRVYQINDFVYSYYEPTISNIASEIVPSIGGIGTFFGSDFGYDIPFDAFKVLYNGIPDLVNTIGVYFDSFEFEIPPGNGKFILTPVINGLVLQDFYLSYQTPVITEFMPLSADPSWELTIFGYDFGYDISQTKVYIGIMECPITYMDDVTIYCNIPMNGRNDKISIKIANHDTIYSDIEFKYPPPLIQSMSSPIPTKGSIYQLHGQGFGISTDYYTNMDNCKPQNTLLECSMPIGFNPRQLDFTINDDYYDNSTFTLSNVYIEPFITHYISTTSFIFVMGSNLLAERTVFPSHSGIYLIDEFNNEILCPSVFESDYLGTWSARCQPYLVATPGIHYNNLYVKVGSSLSNTISFSFYI